MLLHAHNQVVLTNTISSICSKFISRSAATHEGSLCVGTDVTTATVVGDAFIDIWKEDGQHYLSNVVRFISVYCKVFRIQPVGKKKIWTYHQLQYTTTVTYHCNFFHHCPVQIQRCIHTCEILVGSHTAGHTHHCCFDIRSHLKGLESCDYTTSLKASLILSSRW